jgi:hypothetical protein
VTGTFGAFAMHEVEILDGAIQVDAGIVGQGLGLEAIEVRRLMLEGKLTSSCERGVNEDAGLYRLTFFHEGRRLRLTVDDAGRIVRRSLIDFGKRALPARLRNRRG